MGLFGGRYGVKYSNKGLYYGKSVKKGKRIK